MFITLEGIEGSGKGTLLAHITSWLSRLQRPFVQTREPGGSELGCNLRAMLLDVRQDIVPEAELFLYLADRAQHVQQVIRPALVQKQIVLSDRYADSTIVYQGYGRGLDLEQLIQLNEIATGGLWPETTLLLDLAPEIGLERAIRRNQEQGISTTEGRFEAEALEFHHNIRQGYLDFAQRNNHRYVVLDATLAPKELAQKAMEELQQRHPTLMA